MKAAALLFVVAITGGSMCLAQDLPDGPPRVPFHLTARPWQAMNVSRDAYLDAVEGVCRFTVRHLGPHGEVIDPFLKREHQYSTPYFAFAVGTLAHAGRAKDLLPNGVRAMDHATACLAKGRAAIPDNHGEFFIPCLAGALEVYKDLVPPEKLEQWRGRMRLPVEQIINGKQNNNWRAYAMRGEWMRANLGLVDRAAAVAYVEDNWANATQRERIGGDKFHLYQDRGTDPESHAVEPVGRGNLLGLVAQGYDGPSAEEIRKLVESGTAVTLLLQDPSGQCPPDGRADNHVWNDVLYQLCFDVMAERAHRAGDARLAGQYRRAAMLAFASKERWRRSDGAWAGSYFITKNRFDPADRIGYQNASNIGNYNGAVMLHLAEAYLTRATDIPEQPAPSEIGGFAFATDPKFASAVANAGGMQMFAALRGDRKHLYNRYWTSLGVNRFARAGWDTRLGPSDGARDFKSGRGVTFAPTWIEGGKWVRLADVPERYAGRFSVQFAHPLLVRCAIDYAPTKGNDGPSFRHEFLVTPDGVLATLGSSGGVQFGCTWPVLENDGAPLTTHVGDGIATTAYDDDGDQQSFLLVGEGEAKIDAADEPPQSSYGWLRPLRVTSTAALNRTFVYPRNPSDPAAADVRRSFRVTDDGFESDLLGNAVRGTLYVGRTAAGGEGDRIDTDGDGIDDVLFDAPCRFVLQLQHAAVTAVEADRKVNVSVAGRKVALAPHVPVALAQSAPAAPTTAPALSGPLGEPIQLFNGKNLDGWVWYQRPPKTTTAPAVVGVDDVWSVRDGVLHTRGKPTGYIRTERDFPPDYVLTVEFRHIAKGNGGILFAMMGEDKIWPRCLEVQGATGEEGDIRNIAEFKMTMDPARVEPRRLRRIGPSSEKPVGEWETVQVIADHGNLTVTLNGVLQNGATDTEPLSGKIGLQSEGGEMEFRKIELTPIEKTTR